MRVSLCVVTNRAAGDDSSGEVTPKLPRSSVVVGDPKEPASWRRGSKAGASYRTFGLCRLPAGDGKHSMWAPIDTAIPLV
jgi:hypothetical protein